MVKKSEQTQVALFKRIWLYSKKKSFISGLYLRDYINTDKNMNLFAHVLAKGLNKYPHFKYFAYNIALLTPEEHHLFDHGTEEAREKYANDIESKTNGRTKCDWEKLYKLEEELKEMYKKYFPSTYQGIISYKYSPEEVYVIISNLNKAYFDKD